MKSNASIIYSLCLVVGDFLALVAAFIGGFLTRGRFGNMPVAHPIHVTTYISIFVTLLPFWILVFALLGLYSARIYEQRFREAARLLIGSFVGLLFVAFWAFVETSPIFPSKLVPVYGFIFGFVLVVIFRNLARMIRTILFRYQIGLTSVLIVGKSATSSEIIQSLADSRKSGYRVVGVVGAKSIVADLDIPAFRTFKEFVDSKIEKPDGIIQAELYTYESKNREILNYAQEHHINYRFLPGNSELFVGNLDVELFRNSIPVIAVHQTPLFGWGRIVKRSFDIAVSGLAIVIASPFFILIFLALGLSGGQPVYRRKRLTLFGSDFTIYKFRSLKKAYNGLDPESGFAKMGRPDLAKEFRANGDFLPNDPRISRLGRLLRATSLDELPQLVNIFKGDISLVGPRALIAEELEKSQHKHQILSVKSGLTGLAVVSGRKDLPFEERRQLDLYYVQNWSFWLDIQIIFKTIRVVLSRDGAK